MNEQSNMYIHPHIHKHVHIHGRTHTHYQHKDSKHNHYLVTCVLRGNLVLHAVLLTSFFILTTVVGKRRLSASILLCIMKRKELKTTRHNQTATETQNGIQDPLGPALGFGSVVCPGVVVLVVSPSRTPGILRINRINPTIF